MNAPVRKSTITRAVVGGEGHGVGGTVRLPVAVGPPQDASENIPRAVKTQTQVSGGARLECETSPKGTTSAATICGDGPRNADLAVARARSRDTLLATGGTAGGVVGTGYDDMLDGALGDRGREVPASPGEGAPSVETGTGGELARWVPPRKDPAATTSIASAIHPDRGMRRRVGPLTGATGAMYPWSGGACSLDLMAAAAWRSRTAPGRCMQTGRRLLRRQDYADLRSSAMATPLGDESLYQMLRTSATLRAMRSPR